LENGSVRPQLYRTAYGQRQRPIHFLAVEVSTVGGVEVNEHPLAIVPADLGVATRDHGKSSLVECHIARLISAERNRRLRKRPLWQKLAVQVFGEGNIHLNPGGVNE